jgi:hypothetical protein
MAEIIQFREVQAARERAQRRRSEHQDLQRALDIMRDNLAAVAEEVRAAPDAEQAELLDRVENLVGLIRYGMRMIGGDPDLTASRR